jgi:segregation and condensation protein B
MTVLRKETVDAIDEAGRKRDIKIIEAILFVSGRFLDMKDLIAFSDMNPIIIREILENLQESYDEKDSALQITEKNGRWKMDVKPEYSNLSIKLAGGSSEFSKAEQGTLALIAVKQPIKQSVVIKIRGNKAYDHIKRFFDLDLIKKKKQGHTWELSLSEEFYDYFGVEQLKQERGEKQEGEE